MDSGDPFWTAAFVLLAAVILILFGLMLRRSLSRGSCCCGCSKAKKGEGCSHCSEKKLP